MHLVALALCLLLAPVPAAKPAAHPFGWEDMFAMLRLADPQPSPDGKRVLFTRTAYDVEENASNADLAWVDLASGEVRRLTHAAGPDVNGRWSADGKAILFLSARSGSMQLWRMPADGGEAEQLTRLPLDLEGFEPSPDGGRVLFWAFVFPDCKDLDCTAKRLAEREASKVRAKIFERTFVRHWDTWMDGRRQHLFVLPLAGGAPLDLMPGWDQDAPTRPFGGAEELDWSPDGKQVAFASKPAKDEPWQTNVELYLALADGKAPPRLLTAHNPAWDTHPRFSPDGGRLAYLAMARPGFEADRFGVQVLDLASGKRTEVAAGWDRSPSELVWAADGKTLYAVAEEEARAKIFALDLSGAEVRTLVAEGTNGSLALTRLGALVFARSRMVHPAELFAYDPASAQVRKLTRENDERLRAVQLSEPEEFWFENDGRRLHAWLLRPVGFQKGKKYPLAFLVHGGPQGCWEDNFHYRWNPQFYAGAGYVTLAIDFRGSTSYGQAFTDAIRGDWGPGPYSDLMAGLKHALAAYDFIDARRMCALGASFGGYMVNWIAGQDHPFQCLVSHDGDFDLQGAYYNTEELWFPEWEMKGPPWESRAVYERNSPSRFVERWKTPTLVIQGALDFRVIESEGLSTFNALQRRGVPSKLLYFPDENHWVLKPQNSRLWHRTVLEWLDRYTGTKRPR